MTFRRDRISTNNVLWAALQASGEVVSFERGLRHLDQAFLDLTEPGVPT